jgi:hypothetical protein
MIPTAFQEDSFEIPKVKISRTLRTEPHLKFVFTAQEDAYSDRST